MAAIPKNFNEGGSATSRGHGKPTHADVLRDVADDISAGRPPATVANVATDLTEAIVLVNELKIINDNLAAAAVKTTKS